jgi:hypothetical protein
MDLLSEVLIDNLLRLCNNVIYKNVTEEQITDTDSPISNGRGELFFSNVLSLSLMFEEAFEDFNIVISAFAEIFLSGPA